MPVPLFNTNIYSLDNAHSIEPRLQVMGIILAISLFAVSFPGVSKTIPFLRIPHLVFFIGKHFGTGVILATAFIHLLQDSFEALQKRQVKEHYNNIGKHTGLIILASLLIIFLIEYISTSYVDHLHAEASLPPTPSPSEPPSRPPSRQSSLALTSTDETTPLLRPLSHSHGHAHHTHIPGIATRNVAAVIPIEVLTNSPRIIKMRGCTCLIDHACVCPASLDTHHHTRDALRKDHSRSRSKLRANNSSPTTAILVQKSTAKANKDRQKPRVGRRRQVIGLLVLQMGIMIHSIVIGLTLSITTGADFTSLTTAVIFHQLFEGLSLGIRIAALPPLVSDETNDPESLGARYQHGPPGGQSFLRRILTKIGGERGEGWLKSTLAILFGVTTPAGMGLGMVLFKVGDQKEGKDLARMYLIQGLMSAISAGMLIYASTVEMIAGDFVFGDVEGHGHHGHGHTHDFPTDSTDRSSLEQHASDTSQTDDVEQGETIVDENEVDENHYRHHHHHHHPHGQVRKKALAIISLLAGVGGMVLVGLGE